MLSYYLKRLKRPIVLLITFFFPIILFSQQIEVTNVSATPICAGNNVTITFNTISGNGNGNKYDNYTDYHIYISDRFGFNYTYISTFNTSGVNYCSGKNCTTYNITKTFTIPSDYPTGSGYKIIIASSNPNFYWTSGDSSPFTINNIPVAPISVNASSTTICSGNNTTLSFVGGSGATFNWYTSSCGGTLVGSGNNTVVSPTTTTTYYGRWGNSCGNSTCKTVTVTVNQQPIKPVVGTITQPACVLSTGSVVLNGLPTGNWTINPGAIAGTGTSTTISGLLAGTYNYTVTNSVGCTSLASTNVVINVQPSNNIWNGSKDTNWNDPLNWCTGVPSITNNLDVLIPSASSTPNSPTLGTGSFGYVENIIFESGSILTIENNYLFVKKNLKLNGKIDLNNESQLVQDTGSVFDPLSIGTIEIDQQGTSDNFKYNYWGSPVNSTGTTYTIAGVLRDGTNLTIINESKTINFGTPYTYADGIATSPIKLSSYWMYKFDNKTTSDYNSWSRVGKDGVLKPGEGYTMKGSNSDSTEQNYTFVGKPNNGNIYLPINTGKQYLIGNPYPSAIDAKEFIRNNISSENGGNSPIDVIDGTLYFWDHFGGGTHLLKSYEGGYSILTLIGSEEASAIDPIINDTKKHSIKAAQRFIPVAQGFFVTGAPSLTKTEYIQFNNNQRVFKKENASVSVFLKGNSKNNVKKEGSEENLPRVRLQFNSPKGYKRQLLVGVDEHASNKYDLGYDAAIQNIASEDMFWVFDEGKFIIQGVNNFNDDQELPLGIIIKQDGFIKIQISDIENVETSTEISIKDNITGLLYKINNTPFEIELAAGEYKDRFSVVFKPSITLGVEEEILEEGIKVYMNKKTSELQIINNIDLELLSVYVFNYLGQKINSWTSKQLVNDRVTIPIKSTIGVYLVKIKTANGDFDKKIIVD